MKLLLLILGWGMILIAVLYILGAIIGGLFLANLMSIDVPLLFSAGGILAGLIYYGYQIVLYARK